MWQRQPGRRSKSLLPVRATIPAETRSTTTPAGGWSAILFLGICCSALGYLFWYGALERVEVSRVAAFLYVEPLVTLVAAVIVLHEGITASTIVGGIVVLLSVFVVQRART